MKAGPRRHRVMIKKADETITDFGDTKSSWRTHATRWASIKSPTSKEVEANRQVGLNITHVLECPYVPDLTAKMRVTLGSRTFEIVNFTDMDLRQIEHRIECLERV